MREANLRRNILIVSIVSAVLAGLILLIMKLRFFDAINKDITDTNAAYQTASQTAAGLKDALEAQKVAENNSNFAREEVNTLKRRFRTLNFDLSSRPNSRQVTWQRYLNEYYTDYGVELRKELIQSADESGVIINTSVKVQAPPQNPEDVVTPPGGFLKPLTDPTMSVRVDGSLPNILRFFNRLNQSEILMTTGNGFTLSNNPLGVRASFTVTPYLVASGPDAQLPAGGAPAAAPGTGAPGVPGGPPVPFASPTSPPP